MGVDPGTIVTGWGVIAREATTARLVAAGVIRNRRDSSMPDRLLAIATALRGVMDSHRPAAVAVESAFYGKNAQSALKLGHARGVALLAAAERAIPTAEYSPREVKHSVVGSGGAGKEQVRSMVKILLSAQGTEIPLDASDALAVALCHIHRGGGHSVRRRDWKSFVDAHPERVAS